MKSVRIDGVEEVRLVIRNVDGVDVIFTSDGKILANQGTNGHFYYIGDNPRYKTFRTALLVDHDKVDVDKSVHNG